VQLVTAVVCQVMYVESLFHHSCVSIVDNLDIKSETALASSLIQLSVSRRLVIFFNVVLLSQN
jgi:hypothetical protein